MGQRKKNAARGPFLLPARGKRQQDFSPFEYSGHGCSESAQADFAANGHPGTVSTARRELQRNPTKR
jgi:hypothetical protein